MAGPSESISPMTVFSLPGAAKLTNSGLRSRGWDAILWLPSQAAIKGFPETDPLAGAFATRKTLASVVSLVPQLHL